jgi:hypothetical protein
MMLKDKIAVIYRAGGSIGWRRTRATWVSGSTPCLDPIPLVALSGRLKPMYLGICVTDALRTT